MRDLITGNRVALREAIEVLALVNESEYTWAPTAGHGSIGEHMRHVADHYSSLLESRDGIVDYTRRRRGSEIETDPAVARNVLVSIEPALSQLEDGDIEVRLDATVEGNQQSVRSTMARELAFVASHATHHFAVVALLLNALGKEAPHNLGVAPTTQKWRRQQSSDMNPASHREPRRASMA